MHWLSLLLGVLSTVLADFNAIFITFEAMLEAETMGCGETVCYSVHKDTELPSSFSLFSCLIFLHCFFIPAVYSYLPATSKGVGIKIKILYCSN